jgi:MFS family permease
MAAPPDRITFREVFGIAEFRALWFGELLSIAGDQLARVALSILVFTGTNSATLTGLTYALTYAPSLLGGIFLTGFADRFPRRSVMVLVDVLRAGLILLVALPGMPFWLMCVLVGGVSLLNPPFKASQLAMLPQVLSGDRFVVGMGIRSMTVQSAQLLGFAGGGALLIILDPHVALAIDAATFLPRPRSCASACAPGRPRRAGRSASRSSRPSAAAAGPPSRTRPCARWCCSPG